VLQFIFKNSASILRKLFFWTGASSSSEPCLHC